MSSKQIYWVVIVTISILSGWQVIHLKNGQSIKPDVLAETTMSLEERVASLENRVAILERNTGIVSPVVRTVAKEQYQQLSGGKLTSQNWKKIDGTDFAFDLALYGGSAEVTWQGWIDNGNGSVRIYDATNHRAVDYSEMSVDSGVRSSFYSKPISIWRGHNQYYIEGKNSWGELVLTSPRLKIVTR